LEELKEKITKDSYGVPSSTEKLSPTVPAHAIKLKKRK
jgi:hypothetical protein